MERDIYVMPVRGNALCRLQQCDDFHALPHPRRHRTALNFGSSSFVAFGDGNPKYWNSISNGSSPWGTYHLGLELANLES